MNKKTASKPETVTVKMACIYSGDGQSWGVGQTVDVSPAEAERLVKLSVASVV